MVEYNGNIQPPTLEQIESPINCQKVNKAPDIVDIPFELIKSGGPGIMKAILNLVLPIGRGGEKLACDNTYNYTKFSRNTREKNQTMYTPTRRLVNTKQFFRLEDYQLTSYARPNKC